MTAEAQMECMVHCVEVSMTLPKVVALSLPLDFVQTSTGDWFIRAGKSSVLVARGSANTSRIGEVIADALRNHIKTQPRKAEKK